MIPEPPEVAHQLAPGRPSVRRLCQGPGRLIFHAPSTRSTAASFGRRAPVPGRRPGRPTGRIGGFEHNWQVVPHLGLPGEVIRSIPASPAGRSASRAGRPRPGARLRSTARVGLGAIVAGLGLLVLATPALAHTDAVPLEPGIGDVLLGWSFDPTIQLPVIVAAVLWIAAVRRVNAAHPASPVPARRSAAFFTAIGVLEVALQSAIERYDDVLFLDHMIQHVLLIMVVAPLVVMSGPITLALRAARPEIRRRYLLPILHSRIIRVVGHPVVAWILFTAVLWGTHFSPFFNAALDDQNIHDLEHIAFLGSAMLFWWPAAGIDPSPWRMPHPARALYVFLQMPQNTFLSLSIFSATSPLYPHYVTIGRTWGPTPLADQQAAAAFMWVTGDMMFLVAILAVVYGWMRHEEREAVRIDARLDAERAVMREREDALAAKHAAARDEHSALAPGTSGTAAHAFVPGTAADGPGAQLIETASNPGDATGRA